MICAESHCMCSECILRAHLTRIALKQVALLGSCWHRHSETRKIRRESRAPNMQGTVIVAHDMRGKSLHVLGMYIASAFDSHCSETGCFARQLLASPLKNQENPTRVACTEYARNC